MKGKIKTTADFCIRCFNFELSLFEKPVDCRTLSSAAVERERVSASTKGSTVRISFPWFCFPYKLPWLFIRHKISYENFGFAQFPVATGSEFRIQQAKSFAVAQAKQDGCTGNFKILDSPFGNFLLPVIPSPAEFVE